MDNNHTFHSLSTINLSSTAEKIKTLADFAKAAYAVQPWESKYINDPKPGALTSYQALKTQGWIPLDFNIPTTTESLRLPSKTLQVVNKMHDGFYTNANAAALVARSSDSLVIAFRGTNDSEDKDSSTNPYDRQDQLHPDEDHWKPFSLFSSNSMSSHYQLFAPLLKQINSYLAQHHEINKVFVTGHSMGGSMAIEYMSQHRSTAIQESVVFAAAPFIKSRFAGIAIRKDYQDDGRITQIEIAEDPVAKSWDVLLDNNRPGQVARFYGDNTLSGKDRHVIFTSRDANHSMNFYQKLAHNIDDEGWDTILKHATPKRDAKIYLGAKQVDTDDFTDDFVVAKLDDTLSSSQYDIIYGGVGNDFLTGGINAEVLLGGAGDDILIGKYGRDTLSGGSGSDRIYAQGDDRVDGGDGIDTLILQHSAYAYRLTHTLTSFDTVVSSDQETVYLNDIERIHFSDKQIALDLEGHAGLVAKVIGAVFGSDALANKSYVGIGLKMLEEGYDYESLMEFALHAAGAKTDTAVVSHLYHQVTGRLPSPKEMAPYLELLNTGTTRGELGIIAGNHELNIANIDLVGLSETGIEYI